MYNKKEMNFSIKVMNSGCEHSEDGMRLNEQDAAGKEYYLTDCITYVR
jgi:hypothetical protein